MNSRMKLALAALTCAAALLSACTSTPITEAASESKSVTPVVADAQSKPQNSGASAGSALAAHLDPNSPIYQKHSIYFDFDDYSIKQQYKSVIELHANYLKANPQLRVRLEGNADERGGREYNLSLGQKRSEAVKRGLSILGVSAGAQEAVSFGKEKPKAAGHDEAAWAENRRVDIVYVQK